jgi:hypothetical protein
MTPPGTKAVGRFNRAPANRCAGMALSQEETKSAPSAWADVACNSAASASTSREASESAIAGVPCVMPSHTSVQR